METPDDANASDEALETECLAWLNQLLSGAVTHDQAEAFSEWRASRPERAEAFARMVQFRRTAQRAIHAQRRAPIHLLGSSVRPFSKRIGRRAFIGGALAASGAGLMVLQPFDQLWPSWSALTSDYHTTTGEQRELSLAPGVIVDLNTRTSLSRRRVEGDTGLYLASGEAAVTAKRPLNAPFKVLAGAGRTNLTQGSAIIRVDKETVCVTCLNGTVQLVHPQGSRMLASGQQVAYSAHDLPSPMSVDLQVVAAWRRGLLIFRDAPLQQVVDQLNRYRAGRIILIDATLARRPVYGVFHLRQMAEAVQQVQALTGATAINLPGGVVLLG